MACFPSTMPWKGTSVGRMRDRSMPMVSSVECLGVHDIAAVASIHQYLGEPLHADDQVDHDRVSSWQWDTFWVVSLIKGYGGLRPSEEGRHGWLGHIDLVICKLLAALGVIGR